MPYSSLQRRLHAANVTASAYALAAGRYTPASLAAALATAKIIALGKPEAGERQRGLELVFFGTGADDSTVAARLWQVKQGVASLGGSESPSDLELSLLGTFAATLSTAVGAGASGLPVLSGERIADTVSWTAATGTTTPKGIADKILAGYGGGLGVDVYTPADNTPGRAWVYDVGNGDAILELVVGTATGANALVDIAR